MKRIVLLFLIIIVAGSVSAQQKNYLKLNIRDCVNCTSALSRILQQDPGVTIVMQDDFAADSTDVLAKFGLEKYSRQVVWSSARYNALSKEMGSELIQFCGRQEFNRGDLKRFVFMRAQNCFPDSIAVAALPNKIIFSDHKNYILITNWITEQQYVYWKQINKLDTVPIEPALVKSIYCDFLKVPGLYPLLQQSMAHNATFRPKITSLCPYNDSMVLGCLSTFKLLAVKGEDSFFCGMSSVLEIRPGARTQIRFINEALPVPNHLMNNHVLADNGKVYIDLNPSWEELEERGEAMNTLARLKQVKGIYELDRIEPTTLNDYLVKNKVYMNFHKIYFDNGYSLETLSNYVLELATGKHIPLPFPDTLFTNNRMDPKTLFTNYCVYDFKYNKEQQRCYLLYSLGKDTYVACFKPGAKVFDSNVLLYGEESKFGKSQKNSCLSWDGKRILYSRNGEPCFRYATPEEIINW